MKFQRGLDLLVRLRSRKAREHAMRAIEAYDRLPEARCPCCDYVGKFDSFGVMPRMGANCPVCESKERHRLLALSVTASFVTFVGKKVLHFAPELPITKIIMRDQPAEYVTADIERGRADLVLNLEKLDLPDDSYDVVVCSHVLEHVDDTLAFEELRRVLRPSGYVIVMIPIIEGWDETFEDSTICEPEKREVYFQQWDHVRLYGRDFRQRALQAGFSIDEFTADPIYSVDFQLMRGEKVFKLQALPEVGLQ